MLKYVIETIKKNGAQLFNKLTNSNNPKNLVLLKIAQVRTENSRKQLWEKITKTNERLVCKPNHRLTRINIEKDVAASEE